MLQQGTRRSRKSDKGILILVLIFLVATATAVIGYLQLRTDLMSERMKKKLPVNALFAVTEGDQPIFFEVFLYNTETHKGAIFHIPTNLGGLIEPFKRVDKISALYRRGNLLPLQKKVEELLQIEITFTVDFDRNEVVKLVDLIGGLDLFIPNPVEMDFQGRKVLLPSGSVKLDGEKVWDYLSYEDTLESEVDQVGRKQKFLQSLLQGLGENSSFLLRRSPSRVFTGLMKTSLTPRALKTFAAEMAKLDAERLIFQRVLGQERIVDGSELLFPTYDGELLKDSVKQTVETLKNSQFAGPQDVTVTLEILNGTDRTGLAGKAKIVYASFDFEVFSLGNADNDQYLNTVVLDRKGNLENAKKVADIIKCTRVHSKPDSHVDASVDVTVILGRDFDGRYCK